MVNRLNIKFPGPRGLPGPLAADGSKGDITVSGGGNVVTLTDAALAKSLSGSAVAQFQPLISHLLAEQTDCAVVFVGDSTADSTSEFAYLLYQALGAKFPRWKLDYYGIDLPNNTYFAPVTIQAGSPGTRTLRCYNGSVAGTAPGHHLGARLRPIIVDPNPLLVIANYSFNNPANQLTARNATLDFIGNVRQHLPVPILWVGQWPNQFNNDQEVRLEGTREACMLTGCGWIDLYGRWFADGRPASYYADSVHGSLAGNQLAAAIIAAHARYEPGANPMLWQPGEMRRDFIAWDKSTLGNATAGWSLTNCTGSIISGAGDFETGGQAFRLSQATANSSFMTKSIVPAAEIRRLWGKPVTFAVRRRASDAQAISAGFLQMYANGPNVSSLYSASMTVQGNTYHWATHSFKVPDATTSLNAYIYASTSANPNVGGFVDIDRMTLVEGMLPYFN